MSLKENKLSRYLIDSKNELKKVAWPTKSETVKHTLIVILISLFTAALIGVLDYIFAGALTKIL
ncbi:MAG: preprotein translocase subunit SecE [Parcubacteria group bacterium]